jgi:hypothetical protein
MMSDMPGLRMASMPIEKDVHRDPVPMADHAAMHRVAAACDPVGVGVGGLRWAARSKPGTFELYSIDALA